MLRTVPRRVGDRGCRFAVRRSALFALILLGLALGEGLLCGRAALGRTASWSFPIDDAYIYSNYVLSAGQGHWLQYNPGEPSGGITSPGWFLLLCAVLPLTAPLGAGLGHLAPQIVQGVDPALATLAGRLYLTAYLLGGLLFALAAGGTARLAAACYGPLLGDQFAPWIAIFPGLILLFDRPAIWGAYSGLEVPLSLAVVPWALERLLHDTHREGPLRLRGSLLLAALLPWARPELAVLAGAGVLWLAWAAWRGAGGIGWRHVAQYAGAAAGGLGLLMVGYLALTGRPLPSSFYAKVSGLRLGPRLLAPFAEWVAASQIAPFLLLAAAALGAILLLLLQRHTATRPDPSSAPAPPATCLPSPAVLVLLAAGAFLAAMTLTLPWFGQEDRYVLPLHPLLWILAGGLVAGGVYLGRDRLLTVGRHSPRPVAGLLGGLLLLVLGVHLLDLRVWAASTYALYVQNIEDAHVRPARWLADHAPPGAVVASEPIGAVRLFSGHPTVDIVGLTTPALLGTYGDWDTTAAGLRARDAQFLLFYPRLWPDGRALPWAVEVQRFPVPDNRIAGSDPIAVYQLTWP